MIMHEMTDHQLAPALLGQVAKSLRVGGGQGKRLLDKNVLASLQGSLRQRKMQHGRGGDGHGLNRRVSQYRAPIPGVRTILVRQAPGHLRVFIANGGERT